MHPPSPRPELHVDIPASVIGAHVGSIPGRAATLIREVLDEGGVVNVGVRATEGPLLRVAKDRIEPGVRVALEGESTALLRAARARIEVSLGRRVYGRCVAWGRA